MTVVLETTIPSEQYNSYYPLSVEFIIHENENNISIAGNGLLSLQENIGFSLKATELRSSTFNEIMYLALDNVPKGDIQFFGLVVPTSQISISYRFNVEFSNPDGNVNIHTSIVREFYIENYLRVVYYFSKSEHITIPIEKNNLKNEQTFYEIIPIPFGYYFNGYVPTTFKEGIIDSTWSFDFVKGVHNLETLIGSTITVGINQYHDYRPISGLNIVVNPKNIADKVLIENRDDDNVVVKIYDSIDRKDNIIEVKTDKKVKIINI